MSGSFSLDHVLPACTFRHTHGIWIHSGDPARVMEIVRNAPLARSRWIKALFLLRGLPSPSDGGRSFIRAMGWTELSSGASTTDFVVGYVTPTARIDHVGAWAAMDAERKVAFSFSVRSIAPDLVELRTETRVWCRDRWQALRFGWYWMAVRPFSAWIRREILQLVRDEAEAAWRATPQAQRDTAVEVVAKLPRVSLAVLRAFFQSMGRGCPRLAAAALGRLMIHVPRRPLRADEGRFLAGGRLQALAFGRASIAGYAFGAGPTVVLLHGLLGSAADFRRLIPAITAAGFTALTIDWQHHGRFPARPVLAHDSIANLAQLLGAIPDLHAVVGHSAGAYFSLLALARMPLATRPRAVMFSAPTSIAVSIRATMRYLAAPRSTYCDACRWFVQRLEIPLGVPQALGPSAPHTIEPQMLCIHDPGDPYAPFADVEALAAADGRINLLPRRGAGHFKLLQDAEAIDAACRFLWQGSKTHG